ncbi:CKLF-like MARVEL transmembrane domain-containing protein 6 isoform X1 [Zootoca vivipara]|uniref:CKLF-like MARVEL transmembrane domain-containing protein 6 isoform X1 n=1 Tax=Zootoca vivipara TaxID=8524 RepID=UPI001590465B|nr:CKLF-like MARVEL transmembrane domain-containing protein 6 isoform X1 [Zootoca vivipara]
MENGAPVYADTTVPAEQPPGKGPRCTGCTADNLGARRLALKASQLALSFLAFLCEEIVQHCSSCGGLYFFEFVSCSAFLLNIPILVTYCTSLYERTGKEKVATVDFLIVSIVAVFFLLASIVFAATNDKTPPESAAIVFGFLATITFCVDAVLMYLKRRKAEEERKTENPANTLNPTENQPLNN